MEIIQAVRWTEDGAGVLIVDQRRLPSAFVERELRTLSAVVDAIRTLSVRGAPAIGIAGAMGLVAALASSTRLAREPFRALALDAARSIRATRPTAVNLPWALDRMLRRLDETPGDGPALIEALRDEATAIFDEDRAMCQRIGEHGISLLSNGSRVLTHCNAGALATGGIGTALAPIYVAAERGMKVEVFVDETRPLLQGSRLTAWELERAGIPVTVLADGMAASLLGARRIDCCLVGADRIAANGDVANKIGTYGLAIVARYHDIPFYVAAPSSTIDADTRTGRDIVIEQRDPNELRRIGELPTAPPSACVYNPAFDVTPAALVSKIVTDRDIHSPPYHFQPSSSFLP